jgi:hypothetical protein
MHERSESTSNHRLLQLLPSALSRLSFAVVQPLLILAYFYPTRSSSQKKGLVAFPSLLLVSCLSSSLARHLVVAFLSLANILTGDWVGLSGVHPCWVLPRRMHTSHAIFRGRQTWRPSQEVETTPMPLSWFLVSKVPGAEGFLWAADPAVCGPFHLQFCHDCMVNLDLLLWLRSRP